MVVNRIDFSEHLRSDKKDIRSLSKKKKLFQSQNTPSFGNCARVFLNEHSSHLHRI